ncbi:Malic enzyme [Quillaja saponaria]|uniref:Malic enzyme n=1 Tax=Quillaja saponaria TaxID=32244 RepID=A0AAD7L5I4_QUISA|nr:Malic enzyme [Quillaja saponaria]
MISLNGSSFLNNTGISGSSSIIRRVQIRRSAPRLVTFASNSRTGDGNASFLMETTVKEMRDGSAVTDVDNKPIVAGGAQDVYGEDRATEDQSVTPWTSLLLGNRNDQLGEKKVLLVDFELYIVWNFYFFWFKI